MTIEATMSAGSAAPEAPAASPDTSAALPPTPAASPAEPGAQPANPMAPAPAKELTLREKIQQKAEAAAARRATETPPGATPPLPGQTRAPDGKFAPKPTAPVAPAATDPAKPAEEKPFTANFKYKVHDVEKEVPELLRSVMKDPESEKFVRELMEKADGIEVIKPKLAQERQGREQAEARNEMILRQIDHARGLYSRGDIDGWLKALRVPEERLLQWMVDKINYQQLPPEQKAIVDARRASDDRAYHAETRASSYQQQHEQLLTQQVQMALDSVLARPEVSQVAAAFDARMGKEGSFRDEMNRRGDYYWKTRNELVPPEKLAQELMALLGPLAPQAPVAPAAAAPAAPVQPAAPAAAPAAPQAAPAAAPKATPVIPNISGKSQSAVKPAVKSIDDLRKRYQEVRAENQR